MENRTKHLVNDKDTCMCWPNLKLAYVIFNVNKILCFYNLIFFRTCLIPENRENRKLRRTDMDIIK